MFKVWSIENMVCAVFLFVCMLMDLRWRNLPVIVLILGAAGVLAIRVLNPGGWIIYLGGIAIGLFFVLFSKISAERFGYGDSLMIVLLGAFMGLWEIIYLLILAFSGAAFFSLILLLRNKASGKKTFPFVPFLALGFIGVLYL